MPITTAKLWIELALRPSESTSACCSFYPGGGVPCGSFAPYPSFASSFPFFDHLSRLGVSSLYCLCRPEEILVASGEEGPQPAAATGHASRVWEERKGKDCLVQNDLPPVLEALEGLEEAAALGWAGPFVPAPSAFRLVVVRG